MSECPEEPSVHELLERITRLESHLAQVVESGEAARKDLRDRFLVLERRVKRFGDHLSNLWGDFMQHRSEQSDTFDHAFERIKDLEVSVFPELARDIEQVHQIIGGDGVPAQSNPLDKRKGNPPLKLPD